MELTKGELDTNQGCNTVHRTSKTLYRMHFYFAT